VFCEVFFTGMLVLKVVKNKFLTRHGKGVVNSDRKNRS
jgi:hypothetical protein